jgi:hypothetical protein
MPTREHTWVNRTRLLAVRRLRVVVSPLAAAVAHSVYVSTVFK